MTAPKLTIGFGALADAATLCIAVDKGFAAEEGLDVNLVREVSWSTIRDKLAVGMLDAAHLLSPLALAMAIGAGYPPVRLLVPFSLALNGSAIILSRALYADLARVAEGNLSDPKVSARAIASVIRERRAARAAPVVFGMSFPQSTQNYQLRAWLAVGGVDADRDVEIVGMLPPPIRGEGLATGELDGLSVGAPWNLVAVEAGFGVTLHLGCDIYANAPSKALAVRADVAAAEPGLPEALTRACIKAARFASAPENRQELAELLAKPNRIGVDVGVIARALEGEIAMADGHTLHAPRFLVLGEGGAGRPDPHQAVWLYAQMVRWGQVRFNETTLGAAKEIFRSDVFDAAAGQQFEPAPPIVEFTGAHLDSGDVQEYLGRFVSEPSL